MADWVSRVGSRPSFRFFGDELRGAERGGVAIISRAPRHFLDDGPGPLHTPSGPPASDSDCSNQRSISSGSLYICVRPNSAPVRWQGGTVGSWLLTLTVLNDPAAPVARLITSPTVRSPCLPSDAFTRSLPSLNYLPPHGQKKPDSKCKSSSCRNKGKVI